MFPTAVNPKLQTSQYRQFKRDVWLTTALMNSLFMVTVALFWPTYLLSISLGVVAGNLYQWNLLRSAENPVGKWQGLSSLFHMVVFTLMIVLMGQGDATKTAVVIAGFLSYKGGLLLVMMKQAFQRQVKSQ